MAYTTQQLQTLIIQEARRQGVDPALALGIAQAESGFNPHAVGDNGRSVGLFQLQPAAAIDAGGDPRQRYEVPENIRLGIAYFKNRVAREGGQEDRGISAYNQGVGLRHGQLSNPQYVSTVRTYQQRFQREQPSLLARVGRALSPASAEAAALPDRAPAGGLPDLPARPPAAAGGRSLPALPDLPDHPPAAPAAPAPPAPAAPGADPRAGYEVEVIPGSTGTHPPAPPDTSLPAMAGRAITRAGQYVRESLTGPIPQEYYAPKPAPDLLGQAGALAIPTMTTAIGAGVLGVPGALGGAYLGRRVNVALGLEPEGTLGDVLSVAPLAVPAVVGGAKAAARGVTRWSRAGQAIQQADEAARTAQQTYQEGVEAAAQQTAAQREAAVAQQQQREAQYQQRLQQQQTRAQAAHEAREAEQARAYAAEVQQYEQAVTGQGQAVTTARGLPAHYGPETPARTLYNRFRDLAPDAQVPLTTLQETAAGIQQQVSRGFETVTPTRLQAVLDEVQRLPEVIDGLTVHRLMQDIGPLTRSPNSQIRGAAKQLYAGFQDALEQGAAHLPETAEARQVLLAANRAARREFAVDDVQRIVRRATSRTPEGQVRFNAARALDQLDRLFEENALFRGSWTPEEWQGLTSQFGELTQAPRIPRPPGAAPVPTPFQPPAPPARRAPYTTWKPDVPGPAPPEPVVPTMPAQSALATSVRQILRGGGGINWLLGGPAGTVTGLAAGADVTAEIVQHLLLRQDGQRYLRALLNADGTINREAMIKLAGGRAALEQARQAQQGTATPQEAQQAVGTLRQRYAP